MWGPQLTWVCHVFYIYIFIVGNIYICILYIHIYIKYIFIYLFKTFFGPASMTVPFFPRSCALPSQVQELSQQMNAPNGPDPSSASMRAFADSLKSARAQAFREVTDQQTE